MLGKKLHPLERKVLPFLQTCRTAEEIVEKSGMQEVEVTRALQWLSNKEAVKLEKKEEELVSLTNHGKEYAKKGLPERQFLKALEKQEELLLDEIEAKSKLSKKEMKAAIGQLKKANLIEIRKEEDELFVTLTSRGKEWLFNETDEEKLLDKLPLDKAKLKKAEKNIVKDFVKRNIASLEKRKSLHYTITKKGKELLKQDLDTEYLERLTPEVLKRKEWKDKEFRAYDVSINVPKKDYGKKHFVTEAIEYIRKIWLEMGFEEMEGNMVQTGFWNLDSLFVPQDHPARDLQDTFYLEAPSHGNISEEHAYERVKRTHEYGWETGSKGWQYEYNDEVARQLMLRTHTTVLSAQTISKLKKEDLPAKFFSVGRNFRNESLDWKHLFEFYQVEGIVVDPNANFRNLIGYLKEFFGKMGFPDVRVRPGHFPYTEPSAEVEVFDPGKQEWVELGGSGIFRPEVTKPLLGFECPVLAWGLGMERIISDYYNIEDIREIYKNDLGKLRGMKKFIR